MHTVFAGPVSVDYSQATIESDSDTIPHLTHAMGGQANGLCGAAVPGVHDTAPPVDDPWEETQGSPSAPLGTHVVPCTEPHRIQIAERGPVPESETYPTLTEWDIHGEAVCAARVSFLLGVPHDPYGRFTVDWLFPAEEGWRQGDRTMFCGVGGRGETADPASLLREDARGADQWYRYQPGQCVAEPPLVQAPAVVPCDQPHQLEITGRVDYADGGPLPPVNEADVRCQDTVVAYLGGLPPQPWAAGSDPLLPESWAAGRRFSDCFLGQWNPDGTMVAVTGSARG